MNSIPSFFAINTPHKLLHYMTKTMIIPSDKSLPNRMGRIQPFIIWRRPILPYHQHSYKIISIVSKPIDMSAFCLGTFCTPPNYSKYYNTVKQHFSTSSLYKERLIIWFPRLHHKIVINIDLQLFYCDKKKIIEKIYHKLFPTENYN